MLTEAEDSGHLFGYGDPSAKQSKLQAIVEQRRRDIEEAKGNVSVAEVEEAAKKFVTEHGPPLDLHALLAECEDSSWGLALAAEFKRASPSKGDINPDLDAAAQALTYAKVGARVLSVLTEPKFFKGSLEDLRQVRLETQRWHAAAQQEGQKGSRPACLRKDFIVDEYQVLEALAHGADTVLLMVSILPRSRLEALIAFCRAHGIEPFVEVLTLQELRVAVDAKARILGVNNRNLHTFELDKGRTAAVASELENKLGVAYGKGAEMKVLAFSGISVAEDVAQCRAIRCSGVLVGEALMRATDPGTAILEMMGSRDEEVLPVAPGAVVVKVCGVKRPADATCAATAGANLIGIIFAKSPRKASEEEAASVVQVIHTFGERVDVVRAPASAAQADDAGASAPSVLKRFLERCSAFRQACKRTPLVVGVFMDQDLADVERQALASRLDVIQLHGKESIDFVTELRRKVPHLWLIKVVHLPPRKAEAGEGSQQEIEEELRTRLMTYSAVCDSLLLDTAVKGSASGGTGVSFDWSIAKKVQDEWGIPVLVAGGLNDVNIADLVTQAHPFGVDVSSGVEVAPGEKDVDKTAAYVRSAKRARTSNAGQ